MHTSANFTSVSIHAEDIREESIQMWLVERISGLTGLLPHQIDITEPFSSYGIDSVAAAGLSGDLANWLGESLPPTLTWDYPTVKLLARYLVSQPAAQWLVDGNATRVA
jgi:acyl carrier protein